MAADRDAHCPVRCRSASRSMPMRRPGFGARPLNDVIHRTGYWALIFLLLSLAVTPLRRVARFGNLIDVRRMIGVAAFFYIAAHLLLYIADQSFDLRKVASEIVLRLYLTIGFIALRRPCDPRRDLDRCDGEAARRHELAAAASDHLCHRPARADPFLPADQGRYQRAGFRVRTVHLADGLSADRMVAARRGGIVDAVAARAFGRRSRCSRSSAKPSASASPIASRPGRVLQSAFDFAYDIRPGWYVLAAGLVVVAIDLVRVALRAKRRARRRRSRRPSAPSLAASGLSLTPRQRP